MSVQAETCEACCDMAALSEQHGRDKVWRLVGGVMAEAEQAADALGLAPAELAQLLADLFAHEAEAADEDMADDLAAVKAKAREVERVAARITKATKAGARA